ncbi:hypothetical protein NPIL_246841 [Nephila pilipes]|uniref:Uncharacterized protein n=1 Tax=Nephila pilipes TaxID=299642 RepID=A0A8X6IRI9_NEPPI|nr:hypothetical protein NPIL_246841 [Nephila pilipes]
MSERKKISSPISNQRSVECRCESRNSQVKDKQQNPLEIEYRQSYNTADKRNENYTDGSGSEHRKSWTSLSFSRDFTKIPRENVAISALRDALYHSSRTKERRFPIATKFPVTHPRKIRLYRYDGL